MNSKQTWNKETGASLVAIMVSMALFGVVAVMASQGFRNISVSGRRVEAAMSAREIESVILQAFVTRYRQYIQGGCATDATFFNDLAIGGLATANYRNVKFYNSSYNTVAPPENENAATDLRRCNSTVFSNAAPNFSHTFYGCFDLKTHDLIREKASNDAFSANRGAFVEMYVKLRDLKTDNPAQCNQMIANSGYGLEVYYALHWATPAGNTVLYDSKLGTFNAAY